MISGEGSALIRRSPRDIFEFVLDPERYRQADTKIRRIDSAERHLNEGSWRGTARLPGLPTPHARFEWRLVPYARLDIWSTREAGLRSWLLDRFEALLICEQTRLGTWVVHHESLAFRPPLGRLIEAFLGPWLARQVAGEVLRLKHLLEVAPTWLEGARAVRGRR